MPQISQQCPHCLVELGAFTARCISLRKPDLKITLIFFQCEVCGQGLVHEYNVSLAVAQEWMKGRSGSIGGKFLEQYPHASADDAPANTPDTAKAAFLDGLYNLQRKKFNPAVAMFRRTLELSVRIIDQEAPKGTTLIKRIERLPADFITPAMKDWAHMVRLGGNDALHDPEDFSEKDAEDLRVFTDLFLTYAFTLPAMLANRKEPQGGA